MNSLLTTVIMTLAQVTGGPPPGQPPAPAAPAVETAPAPAPAPATPAPGTPAMPGPSHEAAPHPDPGGGMWTTLIFFGVMILVFWLLIIRPQQKQRKKQEEFLSALKSGDRVLTSGGVIGRIVSIAGNVVTLEVAKDTRIQVVKGHIAGHYTEGEAKTS